MTRAEFKQLCNSKFLILDGATGTELIKRNMPSGVCPELWVYEHPEAICDIHNAYIRAGSNIVYAPTFGGNRCKLKEFGLENRLEEIVSSLVRTAKENAGDRALVFGDIAPTGLFVEPFGDLPFESAVAIFKEAATAMIKGGADGFAIETMMDLQEARAALLGVREAAPDMPVIVTMTFEASGRTLTGSTPEAALNALQALGADGFGCNCSTGPAEMARTIAACSPYARIPLIAKPNAGVPKLENGRTVFTMDHREFAGCASMLTAAGATLLGGCCGTSPEYIAALADALREIEFSIPAVSEKSIISSASEFYEPGKKFTIIGERINPTGKKAFQAELRENKLDMAMDFAIQQSSAGANILDVNMGLGGIDEKEMMRKCICRLVKTVSTPLCIDSTDPGTVEAALRIYPGRALLNSISAESDRLTQVLPIAARYGAAIIALPLTDTGIPQNSADRMAVVDKIIAAASAYGYQEKDICVDALIMAVASEPAAAQTALEVISRCSERKLNTVCGLSNVSFGMPDRQLVNRTFLGMAIGRGLTMAIANPLFPEIISAVKAGDALLMRDPKMADFQNHTLGLDSKRSVPLNELSPADAVKECVMRGDADRICSFIDAVLADGKTPEALLNEVLIPAITEVGKKYEKKEFFLNHLIDGAEAMSKATAYLEPMLGTGSNIQGKKPGIILATVYKDIHDIGKNIVAAVLKNYGFEVVDLGKNIPPQEIIDAALQKNISLIGLSALMTTTMQYMQETVETARKQGHHHLKFIVGGAVVDSEFATSIGATYAADPMETVNAAKELLNK